MWVVTVSVPYLCPISPTQARSSSWHGLLTPWGCAQGPRSHSPCPCSSGGWRLELSLWDGVHFVSRAGISAVPQAETFSSLRTCTHVRVCTHLYAAVSVASRPARETRRISPRPINDHEAHLYLPGWHSPSEVWDSHWDFEPSSLVLKHP